MFNGVRNVYAGTVEIYRYGKKAVERAEACLEANEKGFISIPVDGGKYWAIGTSEGKYGEYMKAGDTFISVNRGGYAWAKEGTEKAAKLVEFINAMIRQMNQINNDRLDYLDSLHGSDEE